MKKIHLLLAFILLMALPFPVASSSRLEIPVNSILVTTLNDGSGPCPGLACSLRAAITTANNDGGASEITFSVHGTITLTSELPEINEASTLYITGPAGGITIDGNHLYRPVSIHSGASAILSNLTLQNGNSSGVGGAIFTNGNLEVDDSIFQANTATNNGGAIYNAGGVVNFHGSTFSGNQTTSGSGGAIFNTAGGVLTVTLGTFSNNQAQGAGGAIYNSSAVGTFPTCNNTITLVVDQTTFFGNQSVVSSGGAIFNTGGACTRADIQRSLFRNNTASSAGGGLYQGSGRSVLTNSTFTANSAPDGAAVINASGWELDLVNATVYSNSAASGAMVKNSSGALLVQNSIIAYAAAGTECGGAITDFYNNLDSGTSCGWGSSHGSMSNTYPLLQVLANNGGPTLTMALQPASPAVDGVTYNIPNGCPATDQRGIPRPVDGDRDGTARCDIGAYELQMMLFLPIIVR